MSNYKSLIAGITILFVFLFNISFAQGDPKRCKKVNLEEIAIGKVTIAETLKKNNNDTLGLISCLQLGVHDSLKYETIAPLINAVKSIALQSENVFVKKTSLKFILQNLTNKSSNVALLTVKELRRFQRDFFDSSDIAVIEQNINVNTKIFKDLVLLSGYLGNESFKIKIKSIFPNGRNYSKPEKWACNIALARLSDEDAINYCVTRVSSLKLNDEVIDILYPDLIYTKQKQAYDLMISSLYSDEKLCSSTNPNSDSKIICGYRILELLAPHIEAFPLEVLPSGDLKTTDYPKALEIARNWFNENKESYKILNNKY